MQKESTRKYIFSNMYNYLFLIYFFQFPESITGTYSTHPVKNFLVILKLEFIKRPRVNIQHSRLVSNIVTSYLTHVSYFRLSHQKKRISRGYQLSDTKQAKVH